MTTDPVRPALEGRSIAVVGASSGIGLACVRLASADGARVVAGSRSPERMRQAAESLGELDHRVRWQGVDVQDPRQLAALFELAAPVDLIVLCATGAERATGPFMEMDMDGFRGSFGKLWGYANGIQQGVPHLTPEGAVMLVGGAVARKCPPGMLAISTVGNAVEGFCRALAAEIAPRRVNVVAPGTIDTGMFEALPEDRRQELFRRAAAGVPLGRVGRPEDVARAILAVGDNAYMTGTTVDVDGGFLLP